MIAILTLASMEVIVLMGLTHSLVTVRMDIVGILVK